MHRTEVMVLKDLYSDSNIPTQEKRYLKAIDEYRKHYNSDGNGVRIFSVPARAEICGNHTDHNCGEVLAAAVDLDIIAVTESIEVNKAVIKSEISPEFEITYDDLSARDDEKNTAAGLVRGILKGFSDRGYKIGGFKTYITSNIPIGAGFSSSAAYEVLICTILSCFFNDGKIEPTKAANISRMAETVYYGKPCGLMDQLTCAMGGFVSIDFKHLESPIIEKLKVDFSKYGHSLCIINTGSSHSDLTDEYSSIPAEMKKVAGFFDVKYLRQVAQQDIILNINALRSTFGDRAVLRSLHFFNENERVRKLTHALRSNDFEHFLGYIKNSGNSSYKYLQNVFSCVDSEHQAISVGLYFTEAALGNKGACRIHGSGFVGTIQAFVPNELVKSFKINIERIFGANSCYVLTIRPHGAVEIDYSDITATEA